MIIHTGKTTKDGFIVFPTLKERHIGRDVYEIDGPIYEMTDEQIIDACDSVNFGGYVKSRSHFHAYVDVYTD